MHERAAMMSVWRSCKEKCLATKKRACSMNDNRWLQKGLQNKRLILNWMYEKEVNRKKKKKPTFSCILAVVSVGIVVSWVDGIPFVWSFPLFIAVEWHHGNARLVNKGKIIHPTCSTKDDNDLLGHFSSSSSVSCFFSCGCVPSMVVCFNRNMIDKNWIR